MEPKRLVLANLVLASVSTTTASADVIIVDHGGNGDFTQINLAVDAASDGDVLLVKSGNYAPFLIPDRAVSVVADKGATVIVNGYVGVLWTKPGETVLLSGIKGFAQSEDEYALYLQENQGAVRIQDCDFFGFAQPQASDEDGCKPGASAVLIQDSVDVSITYTMIYGGDGADATDPTSSTLIGGGGGPGIEVIHSKVALFDATIDGGIGGEAAYGGPGGVGISLSEGSRLFASGAALSGGAAGVTWDSMPLCSNGGHGILVDGSSRARLIETPIVGGDATVNAEDGTYICEPGEPVSGPGTVVMMEGAARMITCVPIVRERITIGFYAEGGLGDVVYLATSDGGGWLQHPAYVGRWLIAFPPMMSFQANIALGHGYGLFGYHTGTVDETSHRMMYVQGVFASPSGEWHLSNPRIVLVLDEQY